MNPVHWVHTLTILGTPRGVRVCLLRWRGEGQQFATRFFSPESLLDTTCVLGWSYRLPLIMEEEEREGEEESGA